MNVASFRVLSSGHRVRRADHSEVALATRRAFSTTMASWPVICGSGDAIVALASTSMPRLMLTIEGFGVSVIGDFDHQDLQEQMTVVDVDSTLAIIIRTMNWLADARSVQTAGAYEVYAD